MLNSQESIDILDFIELDHTPPLEPALAESIRSFFVRMKVASRHHSASYPSPNKRR